MMRRPAWRATVSVVFAFLALAAWAVSSPSGSSPDDDFHLASIWCGQGERPGICDNITSETATVPQNVAGAPCFAYATDVTAACQANIPDATITLGRVNAIEHSYPGGFYWVMSWFVSPNVWASVLAMRLFNIAVFLALASATVLLIERAWRAPLLIGIAATIVPLGMFIIPSTNPSSWTLYAPVWVFLTMRSLARAGRGGRAWALAATAVTAAAVAAAARSDAAIFVVLAVGLAALTEWRRWYRSGWWLSTAAAIALVSAVSVLAGRQSASAGAGLNGDTTDAARSSLLLLIRNILDLPGLLFGSLGTWNLGWLDTPMPSTVWAGTLFVLGGLVMTAICLKAQRRELVIPLIAASALVVVPLVVSQTSGAPIGAFVQPRYVLPLLVLTLVSLLTTQTHRVMISARQLNISLVVLVAANLIALTTNAMRYSIGLKSANLSASAVSIGQLILLIATILVGGLATAALARVFGPVAAATLPGDARSAPTSPPRATR